MNRTVARVAIAAVAVTAFAACGDDDDDPAEEIEEIDDTVETIVDTVRGASPTIHGDRDELSLPGGGRRATSTDRRCSPPRWPPGTAPSPPLRSVVRGPPRVRAADDEHGRVHVLGSSRAPRTECRRPRGRHGHVEAEALELDEEADPHRSPDLGVGPLDEIRRRRGPAWCTSSPANASIVADWSASGRPAGTARTVSSADSATVAATATPRRPCLARRSESKHATDQAIDSHTRAASTHHQRTR